MLRSSLLLLILALPIYSQAPDPSFFNGLHYRLVGPARGGRVTTVTGVPSQPKTFYMGVASGGLFRTIDGGVTWTNFQVDPGWSNAPRAANGIEYGDWTGSDYYGGRFFAVWASNAQGVNGLPNNPQPNTFDLATARVDIQGVGQPGVYGISFDPTNPDVV